MDCYRNSCEMERCPLRKREYYLDRIKDAVKRTKGAFNRVYIPDYNEAEEDKEELKADPIRLKIKRPEIEYKFENITIERVLDVLSNGDCASDREG